MLSLWAISLAAAPLLLAIGLLRWPLKNRLPRATFPALWGVAMLRLLLPVAIPSRLSVFSLAERVDGWLAQWAKAPVEKVSLTPALVHSSAIPAGTAVTAAPVSPVPATQTNWLFWIWLAVACLLALHFVVSALRCRRVFAVALPVQAQRVLACMPGQPLWRQVRLRYSDRITSPLTYGILRPVILLPRSALSLPADALRYILAHEMAHIRRFDAVTRLLLAVVLCAHWFNPLVWIMRVLAVRDIEMACDERVIRGREAAPQSAYALTLLGMEARRGRPYAFANNFSQYAIEERIHAIMNMKKRSFFSTFAALMLVIGLTVVFATSAMAAEPAAALTTTPATGTMDTMGSVSITNAASVSSHPLQEVQWYTYDEYAAWLEAEKEILQGLPGTGASYWTEADGQLEWTQEAVDKAIAMYEGILAQIKAGALVSKPTMAVLTDTVSLVAGEPAGQVFITREDGDTVAVTSLTVATEAQATTDASPIHITQMSAAGTVSTVEEITISSAADIDGVEARSESYTATIMLDERSFVALGPYDTNDAMVEAVEAFCAAQVSGGLMTEAQAQDILSQYVK